MTLDLTHTNRWFERIEFEDLYGEKCILQESSLAEIDAIWFGVRGNTMHLSRTMFEDLLPHIRRMLDLRGENKAGGLWYRRWHAAREEIDELLQTIMRLQDQLDEMHDLLSASDTKGSEE